MFGYMTATQARALYDRAQWPRPSHVTQRLNAALAALTTEEIEAARSYAEAMVEQRAFELASQGFAEVKRLEELRGFYQGKSEEGDDAADTPRGFQAARQRENYQAWLQGKRREEYCDGE